jgi:hypothetical protein
LLNYPIVKALNTIRFEINCALRRGDRMPKYRKKPVVIEAVEWTGSNFVEIEEFISKAFFKYAIDGALLIETLEGLMAAKVGDYIIKGVKGEFYPCKPDIFEETYERV